ncbi:carbonyl reductase [NADPH] 3-like [Ischnura elegans]|uniref:carbonyl reductase [NADPH] 3-like n=1 Tax=Ischnura elegans TaxID=197161 RepID=UPI001ED8AA30|nr:carbonyl reductase [NADPH] 3-like [Ischnura elegans]
MSSAKVAVVTGGNKGIGYAIVQGLCEKFDGVVYLTARDESRGKASVAELNKLGYKPLFHVLDIEKPETVVTFKEHVAKAHGGIDVLVNNAGMAYKNDAKEPFAEQAEVTVRVNFTSVLKACRVLFPILRAGARVVNISSSEGHLFKISGEEPCASKLRERFASASLTEDELGLLMEEFVEAAKAGDHFAKGWPNSTYAVSKVGLSALTRIQQRAFDSDMSRPGIVVNHVHPGYVDTDMTSHKGAISTEEGAVAPLYLTLLPPTNNKTPRGAYVWKDKTILDWTQKLPPNYVI